jgi:uncharacterized protein YlbG (UPF0298 family)
MVNLYRILSAEKHSHEYREREKLIINLQNKDYFNDSELRAVMNYKGGSIHTNQEAVKYTSLAFKTEDLDQKIKYLRKLNGVGMITASTIMMVHDPYNYAELNYHAWNLLQRNYGLGGSEKDGNSDYSVTEYKKYLEMVKSLSNEYGMKPSDIVYILSVLNR